MTISLGIFTLLLSKAGAEITNTAGAVSFCIISDAILIALAIICFS